MLAPAPRQSLRATASAFGRSLARAPWKRIGLWAGGLFAGLVVLFVLLVSFADWNALRGPIGRMASAATGREIVITGDLAVRPWSFTPQLTVTNLRIGNPARYRERGEFANVAHANVAVRLMPLLIGRFDIVSLDLNGAQVALYRSANGDGNWTPDPDPNHAKPFNLPAIRNFSLRDGRMTYVDERRRMVLNAALTSQESTQRGTPGRFTLAGEGTLNGKRFTTSFTGAALVNVQRDRPYAFRGDISAGATHVTAEGAIRRPFDLSAWDANVHGTGSDLADLYYLLGLTLPNTPPYRLAGHVSRADGRYEMTGITGRVGDSDLMGRFAVTHQRDGRPLFEGDFRSRSLDFDDLLAVLGGPPSVAHGETASPEQRSEAQHLAAAGRILPDARLDIHRVRNMDARVHFVADRIRTDKLPLRGAVVDITLDHGLLRLDPMNLTLARGHIAGSVAINARQDMPHVDLDARLTGARIEDFLAVRGSTAMSGSLTGRVRLSGDGAAVREAAAHASGDVGFVTPHGEVREAFAELTGINVTRGLGLLLTHDQSNIAVRCGIAHFHVTNGIMTADNITVDTDTMLIHGTGQVSLRDETFDLRLKGDPKEARLIRIAAPITLTGPLRAPHVGVSVGRAAGQAGLATLLSMVAPLASVLPFIDTGLAHDTDCAALLNAPARPSASSRVQRK